MKFYFAAIILNLILSYISYQLDYRIVAYYNLLLAMISTIGLIVEIQND